MVKFAIAKSFAVSSSVYSHGVVAGSEGEPSIDEICAVARVEEELERLLVTVERGLRRTSLAHLVEASTETFPRWYLVFSSTVKSAVPLDTTIAVPCVFQ